MAQLLDPVHYNTKSKIIDVKNKITGRGYTNLMYKVTTMLFNCDTQRTGSLTQ